MKDKKVKILMTADTVGGVWNYAVDLCYGLQNSPIEIHLATMGGYLNDFQRNQISVLSNVKVYESNYPLEWMQDPWHELENAYNWLKGLNETIEPDILHFNNYGQACYKWNSPSIVVAHSCVMSWWRAVKKEEAPSEWNKYKSIVSKALLNADIVISPTLSFLNEIEEIYGSFIRKKVIHNGRRFPFADKKGKEPLILCAGRIWDEAKNITVLTELAGHLEWPVFIAGENGHPVTKKVANTENVHYLGPLSPQELQQWMQKASIYVLPAHYEPFGLSALEAANAECALVLGDIGTLKELWHDAAIFVDQRKPEAVTAALDKLIHNDLFRMRYASKAKERSKQYSLRSMTQEYYKLYLEMLPDFSKTKKALIESYI